MTGNTIDKKQEVNDINIKPDSAKLNQVFDNSYDSIYVCDNLGNVIMANPAASRLLNISREELVGSNIRDLLKKGIYTHSTALEALEKRTMVTGLVRTWHGINLMSTSSPLFDENGNITMVITNSRDKDLVDKFIATLEQERAQTNRYKRAVEYLGDMSLDNKKLVAESYAMRQMLYTAGTIAKADSTVMLFGESGTGKEVIARYIHRNSLRLKEPFIPVNCAAIPHELLESEFFGYTKGAFTGASSQGKPGLFELADKGTLFLDEIAELPLALQSKLLRVLETGEVQRLGGTGLHKMNVRLITATNKNLKQMVGENTFREDLYYRLNVIPIHLPPLRERPEDIVALSQVFVEEFNRKFNSQKILLPKTIEGFLRYSWPGNVRELRNIIERLVITAPSDELTLEAAFWSEESAPSSPVAESAITYRGTLKDVLEAVEGRYIQQVITECGGKIQEAAQQLGLHRSALYKKLAKKG
jgi:PAS domain S-box-containing protein